MPTRLNNDEEKAIATLTCEKCSFSGENVFEYLWMGDKLYTQFECNECGKQHNYKIVNFDITYEGNRQKILKEVLK